MAGKSVQFSKFHTTYHDDYYTSPSNSTDAVSSILPIQSLPHRSHTIIRGETLPPLPAVDTVDRTPRTHPGAPPGFSSTSSSSPGPLAPPNSTITLNALLSPPLPLVGVTDPSNLSIHKVLRHSLIPPVNYNLLLSDESAIRTCPELTATVLAEAASIPPGSSIVVTCDRLPWHITITPKSKKRNSVVTVADVLHKLYRELRQGLAILDAQYGMLPLETQVMLRNAFEARCLLLPEGAEQDREREKGLKCIDYLDMNTLFLGFTRIGEGKEGVHWELKVASPYPRSSGVVEESASDTSW